MTAYSRMEYCALIDEQALSWRAAQDCMPYRTRSRNKHRHGTPLTHGARFSSAGYTEPRYRLHLWRAYEPRGVRGCAFALAHAGIYSRHKAANSITALRGGAPRCATHAIALRMRSHPGTLLPSIPYFGRGMALRRSTWSLRSAWQRLDVCSDCISLRALHRTHFTAPRLGLYRPPTGRVYQFAFLPGRGCATRSR